MDTPKLSVDSQKKITFIYGKKDIAKICLPRIRKYKNSELIRMDSGHCGYFINNTNEYIKKLIE